MSSNSNAAVEIENVSDTSLWVAHYRALETERSDALFRDPYATRLAGEKGRQIAHRMRRLSPYTEWAVVSRTLMIDEFITKKIKGGVDVVVNLGAGLDARPYRMNLPSDLVWIEVDFSNIIQHKNSVLAKDQPKCHLQRIELDLSRDDLRRQFLASVAPSAKKILVLTEGVIPYLTPEQVGNLAQDLRAQDRIHFWITEYFDPAVYKYLKTRVRSREMKNAPFQFYLPDWIGFFEERGWKPEEIQYSGDIAKRTGRVPPMPFFARFVMKFISEERREKMQRMAGYMILARK